MANQWHQEESGTLAVQMAAHSAAFITRDQTKHDFGVDLHFEVTDDRGDATGRLLAVQVKSGVSHFRNPHPDGWWFYISERHARYWLNHSLPVVLALHNDQTGHTYWAQVASDSIEVTKTGGSKILVPSEQVLDTGTFDKFRQFASRKAPTPTGAMADSPERHRVVMKQAMEGAARDDARVAFELSRQGSPLMMTATMYHMGDPMGRYVLTAYREFDDFLALVLVVEHLDQLNKYLDEAKEPQISLKSLLSGFAMAMPSDATSDEVEELKAYIALNATPYWGSPSWPL
ncbi:DUF4365 domain-containing protein [Arthrobacter rhombi]|uniref:DUF4365 domain-containing protein n=1 Tax=Arthrobacter rhombi TaxID=71253 RepID=UPI000B35F10A|nr:DUF4365 domain-containing protein [Arthrobacter rhombi]